MKQIVSIAILLWVVYSCNSENNKSCISNFDSPESQQEWTLVKDAKTTGNLDFTSGENGQAAHLTYDVSTGGKWVGAKIKIAQTPNDALGLSFKVKCNGASSIWVYLTDSLQNRFEYKLYRSLADMDETGWQRRFLSFSALPDSVRGNKKALFSKNALKSIDVLIEPTMDNWYPKLRWFVEPKGEMLFDDLNWVTNYNEPIALIDNVDEKHTSKNPWDKTGICANTTEKEFEGEYTVPSVGFSIFRNDLTWSQIEKKKGKYDFSEFDKMVSLAEAHSMRSLLILDYSNDFYTKDNIAPVSKTELDAYTRYCAAAARFFKGRKVDFEIWNEPNYYPFWKPKPNAANYANMLIQAADSVRKNNAEAKIISGGTAGICVRFIDSLGVAGALKGVDGIGFHPYRKGSPESFSDDLASQRYVLKRYFDKNPGEWATEYGVTSSWYGNGLADSTQQWQARIDVRFVLASWLAGFEASMKYSFYATGDAVSDENYGIVSPDGQPRPPYFALKTLRNFTENRNWMGQLKCTNPNAYALQFDGEKDRVLILWTSAGKQDKDIPGYKTRFVLAQKPTALYTLMGKEIPVPEEQNGKYTVEAGGEVVYVVFAKK